VNGVGELVRSWRQRRNLSQQAVAAGAAVSTRYLSFIETGRARPSRSMVARLAQTLAVPLRERNSLLMAAGYAPVFAGRDLDDPALAPVRHALGRFLAAQEPYPALLVDRHWNIRATNRGARLLTKGVPSGVLEPVPNLVRLILHPTGLAARTSNLDEWGPSLVQRVYSRAKLTCDQALEDLYEEITSYPGVARDPNPGDGSEREPLLVQRLRLAGEEREIALFPTVTTFTTAEDVTVSELSIETFFPADDATRLALTPLPPSITNSVNGGTN
jgi:transcriptional regulator with XRE-family HTH domain